MYAVVRRYAAAPRPEEVARRVGEGLVPILKGLPGYRAYYVFVDEDGRPVSVSIVAGRADAVLANRRVRDWVAEHLADLLPEPPEVAKGEVLVDGATFEDPAEGWGGEDAEWADGGV